MGQGTLVFHLGGAHGILLPQAIGIFWQSEFCRGGFAGGEGGADISIIHGLFQQF